MDRPVTSKARGICKYYNQKRGCFAGDKCKFLHGEDDITTPYDQAKICRWYAKGYCRNGEKCWFRHAIPISPSSTSPKQDECDSEDNMCCICLEKPTTYGLLIGCNHVFCIQCIRQWRDPGGKSGDVVHSGVTKKCPLCRAPSRFITPSSHFFTHGSQRKEAEIETYKASMARVPCRYFEKSKSPPFCPYGRDCFYNHTKADGTPHVFSQGVDHYMRIYAARRHTSGNGHRPITRHFTDELIAITIAALSAEPVREEEEDRPEIFHDYFDFSILDQQGEAHADVFSASNEHEVETSSSQTVDRLVQEVGQSNELSDGDVDLLSHRLEGLATSRIFDNSESERETESIDSFEAVFGQWFNHSYDDHTTNPPMETNTLTFEAVFGPWSDSPSTYNQALTTNPPMESSNLDFLVDFGQWFNPSYQPLIIPPPVESRSYLDDNPDRSATTADPGIACPKSSQTDMGHGEASGSNCDADHANGTSPIENEGASRASSMTLQETTEGDIAEGCATENMGEHDEVPCTTGERGRVVSNGGARSNVGGRTTRGRVGMSGKTGAVEKVSGEDGTPTTPAGDGSFMTDGRGRVIGTSQEISWQGDDAQDGETKIDEEIAESE